MKTILALSLVSVTGFAAANKIQLKSGSTATILSGEETEVSCENAAAVPPAVPCIVTFVPGTNTKNAYYQVVFTVAGLRSMVGNTTTKSTQKRPS